MRGAIALCPVIFLICCVSKFFKYKWNSFWNANSFIIFSSQTEDFTGKVGSKLNTFTVLGIKTSEIANWASKVISGADGSSIDDRAAQDIKAGKFKIDTNIQTNHIVKATRFVKAKNKSQYKYILTPDGIVEKVNLTKIFIERKKAEYEELQKELEDFEIGGVIYRWF